jgi:hypothetical protein
MSRSSKESTPQRKKLFVSLKTGNPVEGKSEASLPVSALAICLLLLVPHPSISVLFFCASKDSLSLQTDAVFVWSFMA